MKSLIACLVKDEMMNDKFEAALAQVTLGLFIFEGLDLSGLDLFTQTELDDFVSSVTGLIEAYQNE